MYLDYFALRQRPFLISPDPAFLYPSDGHREALAHLQYGLEREGGFILLSGEVGTGKTTLCRLLIDQLPPSFRLAYILNARLDSTGVLAGICRELGIPVGPGVDATACVELLQDNLLAAHSRNQQTLVIIEEAQNLDPEVLETLRLLTNLETSSAKLLHILLIGQPELLDTLRRPDLRQLNQRVVSRCHLGPLSLAETRAYLDHRIAIAGGLCSLFSRGASRRIHRRTGGIPRLVNLLAERCLIGAYAEQRPTVTVAVVDRAAREVIDRPMAKKRSFSRTGAAALVSLVLLSGLLLTGNWHTGDRLAWGGLSHVMTLFRHDNSAAEGAQLSAEMVPEHSEESADAPGVFERWLGLWGVMAMARSADEACGAAQRQGLRCDSLEGLTPAGLMALDHPLLVTLHNDHEGLDFVLLEALEGERVSVAKSSGARWLTKAEFATRWSGSGQLIWRPPAGYSEPLQPGAHNPRLVQFLVENLMARGYLAEPLVTGGYYSGYLVELVQDFQADNGFVRDGVLGAMTLAGLSAGGAGMPVLTVAR